MLQPSATARNVIPAILVDVREGRFVVSDRPLRPVQPRNAIAATLTASNPLDIPGAWTVVAARASNHHWRLWCGDEAVDVHLFEVDACETVVYLPADRRCLALDRAAVTDDEILREMGGHDWRLASTIGAWYRWLMTEAQTDGR